MTDIFDNIVEPWKNGKQIWLFLDYDGTLAEFAPTPDVVTPQQDLIDLIANLSKTPGLHIAIISGRRIEQIQQLLPVSNILLAGVYGIQMILSSGEKIDRIDYTKIRPVIEQIKPQWEELIENRTGYFLEDKGYSIALHAKYADVLEAGEVLSHARRVIKNETTLDLFQIRSGYRFLEISPVLANKGETVHYLLERFANQGDVCIYIGDDAHDEDAFRAIKQFQGITIQVGSASTYPTDLRLDKPYNTLKWLEELTRKLIPKPQK